MNSPNLSSKMISKGSAEATEHFVDRCLGPIDIGDRETFFQEVLQARTSIAEGRYFTELARRGGADDDAVELEHGRYRLVDQSRERSEIEEIRGSVAREVGQLSDAELKLESVNLRRSERSAIAQVLNRDLATPTSGLVRISDLEPKFGPLSGNFVFDKGTRQIQFVAQERYSLPTFLRKVE